MEFLCGTQVEHLEAQYVLVFTGLRNLNITYFYKVAQSSKGDLVSLPKTQQVCLFVSNISSHFSANLTRMIHRPPHAKVQNKSVFIPFKPFGLAVPRDLLCSLSVDTVCV